jgi:ADP-ribose pyrophosphatase YjhB (NUDIX family)
MKRRIAVRAIIEKDGKLLLAKLTGYNDGSDKPNEYWCTFGGGVDPGEPLEKAVIREVIEETGITPAVGPLLFVQQYKEEDNSMEHIEFFFLVNNTSDFMDIDLSKTTHGIEEIAEMAFVDPKYAYILPTFLKDIDYSNLAKQPTKFFNYL